MATPTNQSPSSEPTEPPETEQETEPEPEAAILPDAEPDALRAEIRRLRDENATARVRGGRADDLAAALVTSYVEAPGRLADPSDLPFTADLLDEHGTPSREAVDAAVTALLSSKPHLSSRRPRGAIEQGATEDPSVPSLAAILRAGV